jgi:hypothetical protein
MVHLDEPSPQRDVRTTGGVALLGVSYRRVATSTEASGRRVDSAMEVSIGDIDRGRETVMTVPLPPNRTGGSPASGSPVGGFTSERTDWRWHEL